MRETIEETTVGDLDGTPVPMASMVLRGDYVLPDGATGTGPCGVLVVDGGVWAGLGTQVTVNGRTWTVVEVHKEKGRAGWMTLESA